MGNNTANDENKPLQAMPRDGKRGAPDGVNSQGEPGATGGGDEAAPYPNPHSGEPAKKHSNFGDSFMSHGGQSSMGYHGSSQLGEKEVKPGSNRNAGAKSG